MIPYGKQDINQQDIDAVVEVLQSDFLTQGPKVPEFEKALINYTGASHALAVNSATSALHIACLALGLGKGDWLWTTPVTFVASANCGLYCGAKIDFVDINPNTYNLCPVKLEQKLIEAKRLGQLPKIVVAVHLCGQPCDMQAIAALSKHYGFKLIEDASHAIGGHYQGKAVGACEFSDITIFSFHPVKIVTTAEGGAALTNSPALADKMTLLRSHGVTRNPAQMDQEPHGPWYYQQVALGFNYRMTDLQGALGLSQLNRLDEFIAARHKLAERYDDCLASLPLTRPCMLKLGDCAWHLYIVRLQLDQLKHSHLEVFEALRANGIGVNLHYIPLHLQPYFSAMGFAAGAFPEAERYYQEAISLPLFSGMTFDQQDRVIDVLSEVLKGGL